MTKMIPTDNAAFLNAFGMIVGGDTGLNASARRVEIVRIAQSTSGSDVDYVAEEVPIALVYNGISHAVMMATPAQLEEFGIGFSLAEGIVADLSEIYGIEVTEGCRGGKNIELTIASENFWKLKEYRRSMTGRTGCGICGVESLEGAVRPTPRVPFTQTFDLQHYERALNYLHEIEELGRLTGATHAAAWVNVDGSLAGGAEDALRALQGVGVHAAREHLARRRNHGVVGAGETRDGVEEDDDVALAFGKALGLLDDHFGHLDVTGGGFVEGGGDDLGLDGALHFGHFLGTFVDEEDEESDVGVVGDDRVGDVLHQDRFAGLRRSDDQGALALADRGDHVDDAAREVLVAAHVTLEHEMLVREERRQVLEQHAVLDALGRQAVDGVDAHECEVAFAVLGRADLAFDRVAGVKIEAADLRRRNVNIFRAG